VSDPARDRSPSLGGSGLDDAVPPRGSDTPPLAHPASAAARRAAGGTEPLWREEISLYTADERFVGRRQFAKFLVLTSFGMMVGNLWILAKATLQRTPPERLPELPVARLSDLPVGGARLFNYPTEDDPCLLVRYREDAWAAYSQRCTHLSCPVFWKPSAGTLACPCHHGAFAVEDGRVLQGPPPRPLPRVLLEQRGDLLIAVGLAPMGAEARA
jgi:Rieske Fe-S protein